MAVMARRAVIHVVGKIGDQKLEQAPQYGDLMAADTGGALTDFARRVLDVYRKKGRSYGEFAEDHAVYPFPAVLESCYGSADDWEPSDGDFLKMSKALCSYLHVEVRKVIQAAAESLVFVEYEDQARIYLLIIILNGGVGNYYDRDNGNVLTAFPNFNTRDLHHAVRISMSSYLGKEDDRYLSFFSRGSKTSAYFIDAVGCRENTSEMRDYRSLKSAIKAFCSAAPTDVGKPRYDANQCFRDVVSFMTRHRESGRQGGVALEEVARTLFPQDNDTELFLQLAGTDDYKVPGVLTAERPGNLSVFAKISIKGTGYSITLDREKIGDNVTLTEDGAGVVFRSVDPQGLAEVRDLLGRR